MRSRALLVVLSIAIVNGQAAVQPIARADQNSQLAHTQLVEKAKRRGIDVYFAGDSITRRWGTIDAQYRDFLDNWTRNFFGWNAANFGWGGDTVQNILWRLTNGELDDVHPKVVVLMAGTNNVGGAPRTGIDTAVVDAVVSGVIAIRDVVQRKAPEATIIVTGITPRTDSSGGASVMPTIDAINDRLARLADGRRVRYININRDLARPDGAPLEGVTVDGLHLSVTGYQRWADTLKPIITEILGPPATTDHAPPPTGDPSAASGRSPTR